MSKKKKETDNKIQCNFKATKEELSLMKIKAKSLNLTASAFIRASFNSSVVSFNDKKEKEKLTASLNLIGNNLNQVAKVLNTAKYNNLLDDIDFDELKDILKDISNDIKEVKNDS